MLDVVADTALEGPEDVVRLLAALRTFVIASHRRPIRWMLCLASLHNLVN